MKRFFLILLFIISQFMLPFVFAKCGGEDIPYDRMQPVDENADENVDENVEESDNCETQEFLTADCVDALSESP